MEKRIAVLPGDGIGKEIIKGAIEILETIGERFHHTFSFTYVSAIIYFSPILTTWYLKRCNT